MSLYHCVVIIRQHKLLCCYLYCICVFPLSFSMQDHRKLRKCNVMHPLLFTCKGKHVEANNIILWGSNRIYIKLVNTAKYCFSVTICICSMLWATFLKLCPFVNFCEKWNPQWSVTWIPQRNKFENLLKGA